MRFARSDLFGFRLGFSLVLGFLLFAIVTHAATPKVLTTTVTLSLTSTATTRTTVPSPTTVTRTQNLLVTLSSTLTKSLTTRVVSTTTSTSTEPASTTTRILTKPTLVTTTTTLPASTVKVTTSTTQLTTFSTTRVVTVISTAPTITSTSTLTFISTFTPAPVIKTSTSTLILTAAPLTSTLIQTVTTTFTPPPSYITVRTTIISTPATSFITVTTSSTIVSLQRGTYTTIPTTITYVTTLSPAAVTNTVTQNPVTTTIFITSIRVTTSTLFTSTAQPDCACPVFSNSTTSTGTSSNSSGSTTSMTTSSTGSGVTTSQSSSISGTSNSSTTTGADATSSSSTTGTDLPQPSDTGSSIPSSPDDTDSGMIINGNFEDDTDAPWTSSSSDSSDANGQTITDATTGNNLYYVRLSQISDNAPVTFTIQQSVDVVDTQTYFISMNSMFDTDSDDGQINVYIDNQWVFNLNSTDFNSGDWSNNTSSYTSRTTGSVDVVVEFVSLNGDEQAFSIDDISMFASSIDDDNHDDICAFQGFTSKQSPDFLFSYSNSDATQCRRHCEDSSQCKSFTISKSSNTCYLFSDYTIGNLEKGSGFLSWDRDCEFDDTSSNNTDMVDFSLPSVSTVTCDNSNGTLVVDGNNNPYIVICGSKIASYSAITTQRASSLQDCLQSCQDYGSSCVGISFAPSQLSSNCRLNSDMSRYSTSNSFIYETINLRKMTAVSAPTCPSAGQLTSLYTTKSKSTYSVVCSVDFPDNNISHQYSSSLQDCLELCSGTSGCVGVTFVPDSYSYCWLKSSMSKDSWTPDSRSGLASAYLSSYPIHAGLSTLSTCPGKDGTVYVSSSTGAGYYIKCNNDIYGFDIYGTWTSSSGFNNCLDLCSSTSGCTAVGFYTKPVNPGVYVCYLKNGNWRQSDIHYAAGAGNSTVATGILLTYAVN